MPILQSNGSGPRGRGLLPVLVLGAALTLAGPVVPAPSPSTLHAQVPEGAGGGVVVDSVMVEGARFLEPAVIIGTFGLPLGERVTYLEIQEGQKRLWATGLFQDLEVLARGDPEVGEPVILTLRVEERPRVRRVEFTGLENLTERAVRDSIGFRTGEPYSPDRMIRARRFIQEELAGKGIPFARVEATERPVPDREGEIDLVLEVTEGHRVAIAQVEFEGNDAFTDSELRRAMSTRPEGFWWFRTGQFLEAALEEDLREGLPTFYASHGFLDFQILSDTLLIDPVTGKGRLEIAVEEGPQYRVASFEVSGNRRFPTPQLEQYYTAEEGGLLRALGIGRDRQDGPQVFDQSAFQDATRRVGELYRNQGYLYAQVNPVIDRRPPAEGETHPTVALRWEIAEAQPAYIRRINIVGNTFTHDRIIREQIALLPGQLYSEADILRSYQAISGLGFFETPLPFPDIQPDPETGDVDITFQVTEQQTGSINFGTAMGGYEGVSGFIGYEQPNLFGQAKAGSLRWDFGRFQSNFQLSYTDPSLRQSRISGSISLFDGRDRFFSFATGERKRRGFLTRFGIPVPGSLNTRIFAGYSLSRTEYRLAQGVDDTSLFGQPPGTQSQVSLGIRRRTINHPIFPSVGSEQSWTTEFNGGFLGGDGEFTRHLAEGTWWVPVGQFGGGSPGSRPIVLALGLRAKGGAVVGDVTRFPFDRFWLGGVQFGEPLRGYEETTITPVGYFPRGSGQVTDIQRLGDAFLTVGAEYAVRLNDNISVSTFYEAGNVWRNIREVDPTRMRRGAGLGVQLVTPFGPIGLDYAYGFDKTVPGWQLHFRMGGIGAF
jgi:outer membrane protein insertion porin family